MPTTNTRPGKVLVVTGDRTAARFMTSVLRDVGCLSRIQRDPARVPADLLHFPETDLILLDLDSSNVCGVEFVYDVKARRPDVDVIIVASPGKAGALALMRDAYSHLLRPFTAERMKGVLKSYLDNRPPRLIPDPQFAGFITVSPAYRPLFQTLRTAARTADPLLIEGETGTGKGIASRLVHTLSPRIHEPFLEFRCGIPSGPDFDAILFGYRRGAFPWAKEDHAGYCSKAGSGTLLLDEISDLTLEQQGKLLKMLETKRFPRLGDPSEQELKARIVMTTNQDLEQEVKNRRFLGDLYRLVSRHRIALPPLREHPEDIPVLAEYLLKKHICQFERRIRGFAAETMEMLIRHPFGGNVLELNAMITKAVMSNKGPLVLPSAFDDFPGWSGHDANDISYEAIMEAVRRCRGGLARFSEN